MREEKKEEKPSFLKRVFRGDTPVEVAKAKQLTEFTDLEAKRKKLLERVNKLLKDIKESKT